MVEDNQDSKALPAVQSNPFVSATLPADYKKGDQLLASTVNEIMNRVRGLSRTGGGMNLGGRPEHAHMALVENGSASDLDWRQLVEITGVGSGELNISECNIPSADGLTLIAVTAQPIGIGEIGFAYISGSCLVQYEGDAPVIGDRVGSQTGNTIAVLGESPLIVIGTETIDTVTYALVLFSSAGGTASMIKAKENMIEDGIYYDAVYLSSVGTEGEEIKVKRPNGIEINNGDTGFLGRDSLGVAMFIPCHAREDENLALTLEVRTSDPTSPELGRIWVIVPQPITP